MRRQAWVAIGGGGLGIILSLLAGPTWVEFLAGSAFLVGLFAGIGLLPFWDRLGLRLPPMVPMFIRPRPGQKWSDVEGRPADRNQRP